MDVSDTAFVNNTAAEGGGAVLVAGGNASFARSSFDRNQAGTGGGALLVTGGVADLTGTLLIDNFVAGQAESIRVDGGEAFYSLPAAPLRARPWLRGSLPSPTRGRTPSSR